MINTEEPFTGYSRMCALVGKRFAECWFDNYVIVNDEHFALRENALQTALAYAQKLGHDPRNGTNLLLMGSCGTGKDHLAVSVIRAALGLGLNAKYERGGALCSRCLKHYLEEKEEVPYEILTADILCISDIEPQSLKRATDYEERALLRIIDYRYIHMLPTVITTNLKDKSELSAIIGTRTVSRLFEGCIDIPMFWDDYREGR